MQFINYTNVCYICNVLISIFDLLCFSTMDIKSKGYHMPTVDHTPTKPPPTIVALVGPPKVGKTTLLKCLIKNFTRQKMTTINGPVTLVSGK